MISVYGPVRKQLDSGLCGRALEVGNEIIAILILLETRKGHLRTRNVLFGVFEVLEQSLLVPRHALVDVRGSVREALGLSSLATEHAVKIRANLVWATRLESMALCTASFEETGTLGGVTCGVWHDRTGSVERWWKREGLENEFLLQ